MQLNVYYLDDELDLCEIFTDFFESNEVKVTTFTCPKEAIKAIAANPPDLFFVDYRLPGTTGDLVAQALDPKIPKFLITGEISIVTTYSFVKVFGKPYKHDEVIKIMEPYLLRKTA